METTVGLPRANYHAPTEIIQLLLCQTHLNSSYTINHRHKVQFCPFSSRVTAAVPATLLLITTLGMKFKPTHTVASHYLVLQDMRLGAVTFPLGWSQKV